MQIPELTDTQKSVLCGQLNLAAWEHEAPHLAEKGLASLDPLADSIGSPTRYRLTDLGLSVATALKAQTVAPEPRLEFRWRLDPQTDAERTHVAAAQGAAFFCDYGLVMHGRFHVFHTAMCAGNVPAAGEGMSSVNLDADIAALGGLPVWVTDLSDHRGPLKTRHTVSVTFSRGGAGIDTFAFTDAVYTAGFMDAVIGSGREGYITVEDDVLASTPAAARDLMITAIKAELRDDFVVVA